MQNSWLIVMVESRVTPKGSSSHVDEVMVLFGAQIHWRSLLIPFVFLFPSSLCWSWASREFYLQHSLHTPNHGQIAPYCSSLFFPPLLEPAGPEFLKAQSLWHSPETTDLFQLNFWLIPTHQILSVPLPAGVADSTSSVNTSQCFWKFPVPEQWSADMEKDEEIFI